MEAQLAGWPTPMAQNPQAGNCDFTRSVEAAIGMRESKNAPKLTGWPTPNTPSGGRSVSTEKMDATGRTTDGKKHTASLEHAVKFAGWATCCERDWRQSARSKQWLTPQTRKLISSPPSPSSAGTEKPGESLRLNPMFSQFLMGYPVSWSIAGYKASLKLKGR
jgi:hypothetical protein